ncbi:hypothetical protein [Aeribacillus sp. FSL M8-0235]|uniref:hypothetical protein n=1 Tax=Aeribacillus sp. FSL M8-0235 TaxID=2954576 RepID=UPI0030FC69D4
MAFEKEKAALLEIVSESLKREKFKHINTEKIKINKREGGKKTDSFIEKFPKLQYGGCSVPFFLGDGGGNFPAGPFSFARAVVFVA